MKTHCTSKMLASVAATAVLGAGICSLANAQVGGKSTSSAKTSLVGVGKSTSGPVAVGGLQTLVIDVTGINSHFGFQVPGNVVIDNAVGANAHVVAVGYDVSIEAFDPSWLSEIRVEMTDTAVSTGVGLTPGVGNDAPGVLAADSGGLISLVDLALDFMVGADGNLRIEFWETFDDAAIDPDGMWISGTVTIQYFGTGSGNCPEDLTGDNAVDTSDLLALLSAWGACPGCAEDLTGDDAVDTSDLLQLLSAWGACPDPPAPTGGCCFDDFTCQELTADDCATAGGTYNGNFSSCASCPQPPDGLTCATAFPLETTLNVDTTGNAVASSPLCGGQVPSQPTAWFTVTGSDTFLTVNVDTPTGSAAAVYCGSCATLLCVDGGTANSSGSNPFDAEVTWCAGMDNVYYIAVWRTDGAGELSVTLTEGGACTPDVSCDPPDPNSCVGNCGGSAPGGCFCDEACCDFADCCADKFDACGGCDPTPPVCEGGDCPPGSTQENEPCGDDVNNGCNSEPPIFGSIALGESVCGNIWADGGTRDLDWYELVIATPTEVTINGDSEVAVNMFITNGLCPTAIISDVATGCEPTTTICLAPGTYHFVVGATGFDGNPCPGFNYAVTLTGVPVAECDTPDPNSCVGACGGQAAGGCWCDEACCDNLDCCADKFAVCGGCDPGGGPGGDPPANDECVDAIDITGNINGAAVNGNNVGANATGHPAGSPSCQWQGIPANVHNTVWYSFTADGVSSYTIETCSSALPFQDSSLALYSGACGGLTEVGCGGDDCPTPGGAPYYSRITTGVLPAGTYLVAMSNHGGWTGSVPGDFVLTIVTN